MKKTKLLSFMMAMFFLLVGTAIHAQKTPAAELLSPSMSAGVFSPNVDFVDIDAAAAIIKAEGAVNPAMDNPNYPPTSATNVENILRLKYLELTLEGYQETGLLESAIGTAYTEITLLQADYSFQVVDETWYTDMVTLLTL